MRNQSSWDDPYPAWQPWADEAEALLRFLFEEHQLHRFWPRLCAKKQQRDEALNEIRVARFLTARGYPISDWAEPQDAPGTNVEYAISLGDSARAFVEVKSPGWESELTAAEIQNGRTKEPKYPTEGRAAGPVRIIRRAVTKARPKFSGNVPSTIVISDDCFVNLIEWRWGPLQMALTRRTISYGDGLFHLRDYDVIGAVCLFRAVYYAAKNTVEYESLCLPNENAKETASLPYDMARRLTKFEPPA